MGAYQPDDFFILAAPCLPLQALPPHPTSAHASLTTSDAARCDAVLRTQDRVFRHL